MERLEVGTLVMLDRDELLFMGDEDIYDNHGALWVVTGYYEIGEDEAVLEQTSHTQGQEPEIGRAHV